MIGKSQPKHRIEFSFLTQNESYEPAREASPFQNKFFNPSIDRKIEYFTPEEWLFQTEIAGIIKDKIEHLSLLIGWALQKSNSHSHDPVKRKNQILADAQTVITNENQIKQLQTILDTKGRFLSTQDRDLFRQIERLILNFQGRGEDDFSYITFLCMLFDFIQFDPNMQPSLVEKLVHLYELIEPQDLQKITQFINLNNCCGIFIELNIAAFNTSLQETPILKISYSQDERTIVTQEFLCGFLLSQFNNSSHPDELTSLKKRYPIPQKHSKFDNSYVFICDSTQKLDLHNDTDITIPEKNLDYLILYYQPIPKKAPKPNSIILYKTVYKTIETVLLRRATDASFILPEGLNQKEPHHWYKLEKYGLRNARNIFYLFKIGTQYCLTLNMLKAEVVALYRTGKIDFFISEKYLQTTDGRTTLKFIEGTTSLLPIHISYLEFDVHNIYDGRVNKKYITIFSNYFNEVLLEDLNPQHCLPCNIL